MKYQEKSFSFLYGNNRYSEGYLKIFGGFIDGYRVFYNYDLNLWSLYDAEKNRYEQGKTIEEAIQQHTKS